MCAPPDECLSAESIMQAKPSKVRLHNLYLFIHLVHEVHRNYIFSTAAEEILLKEFNKYQALKKLAKRCDYNIL